MRLKPPRSPPPSSAAVSAAMRGNKRTNTKPELMVRRMLHALGYRYRTHIRDLPGKPDIVFTKRRAVIQVHGCFWHQHDDPGCPLRSRPRANAGYWHLKLGRNAQRDLEQQRALDSLGWRSFIVWECECADTEAFRDRLVTFLGPPRLADRASLASLPTRRLELARRRSRTERIE